MRLFKMLERLERAGISYCFQSYITNEKFYNLMVVDIYGKQHYIDSTDISDIERGLEIIHSKFFDDIPSTLTVPKGLPKPF